DQLVDLRRDGFGGGQRGLELGRDGATAVEGAERLVDEVEDGMAPSIDLGQHGRYFEGRLEVVIELLGAGVAHQQLDLKAHQRAVEEGEGVDQQGVPVAAHRVALDHQLVVVAVDRLRDVAVEIGEALRVGG